VYLKAKWDPNNSVPGTVVMVIMIHGVSKEASPDMAYNSITHATLKQILAHAAEVGFQTITMNQLADFMEKNAKIPPRSLVLLVDDRHFAEYYQDHFIPFLQKYGWKTVTNAWITNVSLNPAIYPELQELVKQGYLDMQAHGFEHNNNINPGSSEDYIHQELYKPMEVISEYFGNTPVAFIWPGGSFTKRGVEVAREAGYRLGFTINPRGPLMFNWVPQADQKDPAREFYLPEGEIGDPLMTLPRYWSTDALYRIDDVINIGDQARSEAANQRDTELLYYDIVCKDTHGSIESISTTP
jgi:peptidoglycan/xylan/chitin deacetylase (PgdA/CDA1 family)